MSDRSRDPRDGFGQYGKVFQEKIMQALLTDPQWAEQMLEVFDVAYFDLKYLVYLADKYFAYAKKYRVFPSLQMLVTIIRDDLKKGNDILLRDQIIDYLQRMRMNPDPGDLPGVKAKALDFCRKQALQTALETAVEHMASEKYEQIVEVVKKAVMVGTTPSVGHEFFEDYDARFTRLVRNCVPTGIKEFDKKDILNGGLGKGELGVIVAPTGVGKSHMLTFLGANALRAGIDVLHYTFELSESAVGVRYDSNLCDINSNQIIERQAEVRKRYDDFSGLGRLFIKEYPTNSASIYTLRSHVERLQVTKGFRPGVIIIDYADIMRSSRQFDSLRHELKLVYEELRSWAAEFGVPIWTASQSNKEGANSDIVDLSNMSEAYGKAMVADVIVSISRKPQEKASGFGRLFMAKNRAGRDGILWPVQIDTSTSNFNVLSSESFTPAEAKARDDGDIKAKIRQRWDEVKRDKMLKLKSNNEPAGESQDTDTGDDEDSETPGSKR